MLILTWYVDRYLKKRNKKDIEKIKNLLGLKKVQKMVKNDLGIRMKEYENIWRVKLPKKTPVIIRVDGRAFHSLTKNLNRPFDDNFIECMRRTSEYLLKNIQNSVMVYTQSDEISILIDDRATNETEAMFNNNLIKLVSLSSAMATLSFNRASRELLDGKEGIFDSRAFILSDIEVPNYFLWRMKDWNRNSIQMVARSVYSPKQLHKKKRPELMEMLFDKDINWARIKANYKNGILLYKKDSTICSVSRKFDYLSLKKFVNQIKNIELKKTVKNGNE